MKQLGGTSHLVRALVRTEQQAKELAGFAHEVVRGDLLQPSTLAAACEGVDTIISTVGASVHINTKGSQSFQQIDFAGNRNLLAPAVSAGVRKFVYVSVLNPPGLAETAYVRAKDDFGALLERSGLAYQILRPTGFFSAFTDLIPMARKRGLPIFGSGAARTNPIDDEEVAAACVEGIESDERERAIGGPDVLTRKEILELVFAAIGRKPKYQRVPAVLVSVGAKATRLFNRRMGDLAEFYLAVSRVDAMAPAYGSRRLEDYFKLIARYS